jgi:putative transposase
MLHFLSSVYSTEVFNDVDVWGFYPSSDSKNIEDEVVARGNERQLIYENDADREHFLALVEESAARFDVAVHGFVLMGNHFHPLAQTRRTNLSRWHWLMVAYSVYFNQRHRCSGHLLEGRYKSLLVEKGE